MAIYFETFEKTGDFEGRSTRKEFWVFFFGSLLLAMPIVFLDTILGLYSPDAGMGPLTGLVLFLMVIPSFSLSVRRLHDIDFSGWWFFVGLVPFVGPVIQLILFTMAGTDGPNRYGASPC
ncbi:MAG TPA: DUF805 domain-containing protein [Pseudomonas sp.]|jgi:uncharacterized membrane protein YhaH (DUF805 family)